jgi:hypothetical protein
MTAFTESDGWLKTDYTSFQSAEAIKRLKAKYCRMLDTRDWGEWGRLFSEEAWIDVSQDFNAADGINSVLKGRDQIVRQISSYIVGGQSVHHVYYPELDILSEKEARGIWAMDDMITFENGQPFKVKRGWGHYHETYSLIHDRWHISSVRLTRLRIEIE